MKDEPLNALANKLMASERAEPSGLEPSDEAAARVLNRLKALGLPGPEAPGPEVPSAPLNVVPAVTTGFTAGKLGLGLALVSVGAVIGSGATLWIQNREPRPSPVLEVRAEPVVARCADPVDFRV